jgi:Zn-ribbon-containing, possibly RNA-binding protein and truncated derivatives
VSKTLRTSVRPIGSALDELVKGLGIQKKLQEYDAVVYWESVVGERIAQMTTATRILQGVLFVHVKTSTWRNELTLRKKEIIDKLNIVIGTNVVKDIKFQ